MDRLSLAELLENWLEVLSWLDFVIHCGGFYLFHLLGFVYFDVVHVNEFSLVIFQKLLHGSAAVASALGVGVSGNSYDSGSA